MKKVFLLLSAVAAVSTGCTQNHQVDMLQRELIELKKEVSQLRTQQKELKMSLMDISQRIDNLSKNVAKNSIEIEKLKNFKKTPPPSELPKEGVEKVIIPENPVDLYKKALDAYYKGKIEEARRYFKEFTEKYKNHELYDNALFWIGQTYYVEGNYTEAIKAWDLLIAGCESGEIVECNKYPMAMLKKAYAYMKMGNIEDAKRIFREIISKFPDSEEAELAQRKLEALK
ncbi:MAG: tetratricopeptide repeat protein [Aquificae bacterium]|nr:tetratricopeptide repeat protein [Aquificota bacterium]